MDKKRDISGVTDIQSVRASDHITDIRPMHRKTIDWMNVPSNMVVLLTMFVVLAFIFPSMNMYMLIFCSLAFLFAITRQETAPIKMPKQSSMKDPNQPHPATGAATKADGIFFLGNDLQNGKEVWLTNSDCRQHFLVLGTTGAGKSIGIDTKIHTPKGWKRIGDISVGELVSTPDGRNARVDAVYPQGALTMCSIEFEDERRLDSVCPDHLWEVWTTSSQKEMMSTKELAEKSQKELSSLSIRLPKAVQKPSRPFEMNGYTVGQRLCNTDREPSNNELDLKVRSRIHAISIPYQYLESSISQRLSVLRGILDHSGIYRDETHSIEFTTSASALAEFVQEIVWGLGGIAKITQQNSASYTVCITHPEIETFKTEQIIVKSLHRESQNLRLRIKKVTVTDQKAESVCILINHPDHLFITENYIVTHNTETLLGFAANALSWSSGFLFCDGKGDVALYAKVYAMARRFGREDDLLVLNFMTGNEDIGASGGRVKSNTMNPFSTGSSDGLTQMVVSLMDDVGGDGAMWKGRATAMLTGVMRALVWLRGNGLLDLNVGAIRDHMNLKKIIELADVSKNPDLPDPIRKSIRSYLSSLPGFQEEKKEKQAQTTLDQHGYLEMQFTKILGSLADVYGHIFSTPYGEVDMYDVVLNRRILVIMLPALEKAQDEIANLGKIVVATLKGMMGATLGSKLEGNWEDVVENRPTTSSSPFLVVLDEVGYYTVEGMALMAAQARSLGFGMIYASQDIPAMKKLNDKEAASIIANTNTKIFMRTEEVDSTGKLAIDTGGQRTVSQTSSFERDVSEFGVSHRSGGQSSLQDKNNITFRDLKSQGEGEMHILFQDKVVRARGFYANPENSLEKTSLNLRANHFLKIRKPNRDELESARRAPELMARMADPEFVKQLRKDVMEIMDGLEEAADSNDEIAVVATTIAKLTEAKRPVIDSACAAVANVMHKMRDATDSFQDAVRSTFGGNGMDEPRFGMPGLADMEFDDEPLGSMPPRGRVSRNFDDEPEVGSPFSGAAQPKNAARRKMPVGASRIDNNVKHGVHVDDGPMFDLNKDISANESVMRSLAALDFDGDQVSSAQINAKIEESLNSQRDLPEVTGRETRSAPKAKLNSAIDALDRAKAAINHEPDQEEAGEGGQKQIVAAFLEQLLSEDEDDD